MKILIVEDEAPAARRLRRLVAAELTLDPDSILLIDNIQEAKAYLEQTAVDLLLLDLDLSGRDGFELLQNSGVSQSATIIVSANVDRALEAFDQEVVDFVPKPVSTERLSRALIRAREADKGEQRLTIRSQGKTDIIEVRTISHVSGADDYVEVVTVTGDRLLHYDRLEAMEKSLPVDFLRVHRSHIVNMKHVVKMQNMGDRQRLLITIDGSEVPVSRSNVKRVLAALP